MTASPYWFSDFNQSFVFSVFLHFLFLVLLMYIPRPDSMPKKETIPLTVSLIPIPQSKPAPIPPPIEKIEVEEKLETQEIENYFSGNPICGNGHAEKGINCERLCSEYCWSRNSDTNRHCDITCDSTVCEMDGGECKVW